MQNGYVGECFGSMSQYIIFEQIYRSRHHESQSVMLWPTCPWLFLTRFIDSLTDRGRVTVVSSKHKSGICVFKRLNLTLTVAHSPCQEPI